MKTWTDSAKDRLEHYLRERTTTPGVDRDEVVRLGRRYLNEVSGSA